uniref:Late endosomal/lysosomal adaptor, MAPK and MTOR activator 1 n=1 Tax=Myotis myotis TaxID=51298 RepID=A0A7J7VIE1_MYOMY|nr:late endosomal/lysosomal adaptor, MAPK and MTOR activator 1 [Myotis myotis]
MEPSQITTACLPLAQMSRPCSPPFLPRQHEYMDRARQYSTRLAVLSSSLTHWKKLPPLPSLTSQPHQVLASEPIPFSDLQQVSRIAAYAYSALSQIRVDAREELVVQFGIP